MSSGGKVWSERNMNIILLSYLSFLTLYLLLLAVSSLSIFLGGLRPGNFAVTASLFFESLYLLFFIALLVKFVSRMIAPSEETAKLGHVVLISIIFNSLIIMTVYCFVFEALSKALPVVQQLKGIIDDPSESTYFYYEMGIFAANVLISLLFDKIYYISHWVASFLVNIISGSEKYKRLDINGTYFWRAYKSNLSQNLYYLDMTLKSIMASYGEPKKFIELFFIFALLFSIFLHQMTMYFILGIAMTLIITIHVIVAVRKLTTSPLRYALVPPLLFLFFDALSRFFPNPPPTLFTLNFATLLLLTAIVQTPLLFSLFETLFETNEYLEIFKQKIDIDLKTASAIWLGTLFYTLIFHMLNTSFPHITMYLQIFTFSIALLSVYVVYLLNRLDQEVFVVKDHTLWSPSLALIERCPLDDTCTIRVVAPPLTILFTFLLFMLSFAGSLGNVRLPEEVGGLIRGFASLVISLSTLLYVYKLFQTRRDVCGALKSVVKEIIKTLHLRVENSIIVVGFGLPARVLVHRIVVQGMHDERFLFERVPTFQELDIGIKTYFARKLEREFHECRIDDDLPLLTSLIVVDKDEKRHQWCGVEGTHEGIKYCITQIESNDTLITAPSPVVRMIAEGKAGRVLFSRTAFNVLSVKGDILERPLSSLIRAPNTLLINMVPSVNLGTQIALELLKARASEDKRGGEQGPSLSTLSKNFDIIAILRVPARPLRRIWELEKAREGEPTKDTYVALLFTNFEHFLAFEAINLLEYYLAGE